MVMPIPGTVPETDPLDDALLDNDGADPVESIARAVLYEGYVLWPYRRSALENRQRFTFGTLYPAGFCAATRQQDRSALTCECLAEGGGLAEVRVELRFLHRVHRQVLRVTGASERPVDELRLDGALHLTWDEAIERRASLPAATLRALSARPRVRELRFPGGGEQEAIRGGRGERAGTLHRTWETLTATVTLSAERLGRRLHRLRVEVANAADFDGPERDPAQRRSLLSAHLLLTAGGGEFVSATDPPAHFAAAAGECESDGVWPVLVGEPDSRDRMLASPIILEDYPRVAPESPGDLFDGGEIDQLLTLDVLALTDDGKPERVLQGTAG